VPVILGHEIIAEIAEFAHSGFAPGERAAVAPVYGCGECGYCLSGRENLCRDVVVFGCTLDGGYAEYMRVPAKGVERGALVRIDESLSDEAGTMIEPLACSLHGLRQLDIEPGDTVAIFGSGPIGISHLILSKRLGAGKVAMIGKVTRSRVDMALSFGADHTFLSSAPFWKSEVFDAFGSEGADVVIVSAPSVRAMEDGLQITKNGGRLLIFGGIPRDTRWERDPNDIHYREISMHGSIDATIDDVRRTVSLAPSLDLDRFVTHRFTLDRAKEAMGLVTSREGMKVIFDLTGKT
jgi:L-iditol 2-dehydrogenase